MDTDIQFTLDVATEEKLENNEVCQILNFLDISVILHPTGHIETDIYYKVTNTHDYLSFHSHHPLHIKNNIPFVLAKRIIVFCSNSETVALRLCELKQWLIKCNYPTKLLKKAFHNAKLQGPAPKPVSNVIQPLVTTSYSNFELNHVVKKSNELLHESKNQTIIQAFQNKKIVISYKQPKNLLRHLTKAAFYSNEPEIVTNGIFKCQDARCKLCRLYIVECDSFIMSNNEQWEIRSHITCNSENVIYYLKCASCQFTETYIGKTVEMRSRMNNHITGCRHGNSTDKFDNHVYNCRLIHNENNEPYFQLLALLKLPTDKLLLTYEPRIRDIFSFKRLRHPQLK